MEVIVEDLPEGSPQADQTAPLSAAKPNEITHLAIASRFNIDIPNGEEDKKLAEIWQYASSLSQTKDIQDIVWQVINLEGTLGAPRLGETRLDRLYRYAKLRRQAAQINQELKDVSLGNHLR